MAITTQRHPFDELVYWEPFAEVGTLRQAMNKPFEQVTSGWKEDGKGFPFTPSAELDETETGVHLKLEVLGMHAEDLNIEVMDKTVEIKGERKSETKNKEAIAVRSEFHYGKFERRVPMPTPIDAA